MVTPFCPTQRGSWSGHVAKSRHSAVEFMLFESKSQIWILLFWVGFEVTQSSKLLIRLVGFNFWSIGRILFGLYPKIHYFRRSQIHLFCNLTISTPPTGRSKWGHHQTDPKISPEIPSSWSVCNITSLRGQKVDLIEKVLLFRQVRPPPSGKVYMV